METRTAGAKSAIYNMNLACEYLIKGESKRDRITIVFDRPTADVINPAFSVFNRSQESTNFISSAANWIISCRLNLKASARHAASPERTVFCFEALLDRRTKDFVHLQ